MTKWNKRQKGCLGFFVFFFALIIFLSLLPETEEKKAAKQQKVLAKQQEKVKLAQIGTKIRAAFIANKDINEVLEISSIIDDPSSYRVTIELKTIPQTMADVQTVTDAACMRFYTEFKAAGIKRNISVWARRSTGNGLVTVYGNTFYSHVMGTFEFKEMK